MMRQSWASSSTGECSQYPVFAQNGSGGTGRVPETKMLSTSCRKTTSQTSLMPTLPSNSLQSSTMLLDGLTSSTHLELGQQFDKQSNNLLGAMILIYIS